MNNQHVITHLEKVLGSTYVLYVTTQNCHWNYTGPHFPAYHAFFEDQYNELREAVDELAERIRQLGGVAPGSMKQFLEHSILEEHPTATSSDMVKILAKDHKSMSDMLESAIADEKMDEGTKDMLIARQQAHDKHHWMLQSSM